MIFYFPKSLISNSPKTDHFHFWEVFLGKWGQIAERSIQGGFAVRQLQNTNIQTDHQKLFMPVSSL